MIRSCSTSLESICKRRAVATHQFYMLRILQTATPTHRQYEALGLLIPGCCTYLEPESHETAVIPNLTQLIWLSISIRKYYQGGGGGVAALWFATEGLMVKILLSCKASYSRNLQYGALAEHAWVCACR